MAPNPNLFAFAALLMWPLVALCLFRLRPLNKAILWTLLGAYLLLPVGTSIKFEGIPALDKNSLPNLAALAGCILVARRGPRVFHGFGLPEIFILMLVVGPFITSELNDDVIRIGERILPGVGPYDALSAVIGQCIFLLPFFLARQFLRGPGEVGQILRALVMAGLVYSLPMLFEVRMSPQLHTWVYGYFPHSFAQQIRDGGFRPVVFLGHGLLAAFFIVTTAVAAAALWRIQSRVVRLPPVVATAYLSGISMLCKTWSALIYGAAAIPLVRFTEPRLQLRIALLLVALTILYPMLRAGGLIPTGAITSLAEAVSPDRAGSLKVRFENEDQLLERAWQRCLFGWGRFGRSRIYDDDSGHDLSVTDGHWVITMGQFGLFGFLAEFGLLSLAVVRAVSSFRFVESEKERVLLAALALILSINVVDLLPNASLSPWTWLLTGALLGRAEALRAKEQQKGFRWSSWPRNSI